MIVLDAAGTMQIFEVGANADLAQELPTILDRLQKGDDLASEIIADHFDQTQSYAQTLAAAMAAADSPTVRREPTSDQPAIDPTNTEANTQ